MAGSCSNLGSTGVVGRSSGVDCSFRQSRSLEGPAMYGCRFKRAAGAGKRRAAEVVRVPKSERSCSMLLALRVGGAA